MNYSQRTLRILRLTTFSSIGGTVVGLCYWKIWSRHAYFEPFTPSTDSLFHLPLIKKINPHSNPSIDDSCVYKIPVAKIKPELLEDHQRGGPKLVNAFAQGMWGGYGYAIQRKLENFKTRNDTNKNDMWTAEECLSGTFAVGDVVTDHLLVISRTNNSIITRGGPPPRSTPPDEPRDLDNIGEMRVDLNSEDDTVEFRFKNIFFAGAGGPKLNPPFPRMIAFLHYEYAKLLLHSGLYVSMFSEYLIPRNMGFWTNTGWEAAMLTRARCIPIPIPIMALRDKHFLGMALDAWNWELNFEACIGGA